jgi:dTDP-4-amino-4,6-dideoxygalactose transaminase
VENFEAAFARYLGTQYCVGLNNGTAALHLALRACDVGFGDEVITTPLTWISTSWAISYVGARPVFVDIDPLTYNLNPSLIERAITPRTKAVLPVHLYGQTCEMDAIGSIASRHGLLLIEDAAQAHGAVYRGRRAGSIGCINCFSFYPGKNLGAFGEGGAVVTDDQRLAQRVRSLRDHAQQNRHQHLELGYNARMEGIQGAVLEVKLRHLEAWNAARRRHAARYGELLADVPGLRRPAPPADPLAHVWHLFVVLLAPSADRAKVQQSLCDRGVATGVHYPTPVHLQPAYAQLGYRRGDFPVAEDVAGRCLSLPMFPELTDDELAWTAASLSQSMK